MAAPSPVLTPSAEPSALQKLVQEGIAYKRECIRLQGIIDKLEAERPPQPVPSKCKCGHEIKFIPSLGWAHVEPFTAQVKPHIVEPAALSPVLTQPSAERQYVANSGVLASVSDRVDLRQLSSVGRVPDSYTGEEGSNPSVGSNSAALAERPVLPVPPLTRADVYPWLNELIKRPGWNIGRFAQFCEENFKTTDLSDVIIAWQDARSSSPAVQIKDADHTENCLRNRSFRKPGDFWGGICNCLGSPAVAPTKESDLIDSTLKLVHDHTAKMSPEEFREFSRKVNLIANRKLAAPAVAWHESES